MWSIWADLWDLFFPECCIICDERLMKHEHFLCFRCLATLPHTNLHLQRNNEVERNFWGKFPVERAASFLYYAKGSVEISPKGNLHLGKVTVQRKGGDNGRKTANMLQFKLDPTELFDI